MKEDDVGNEQNPIYLDGPFYPRHADGRPYRPFGNSYTQNGKLHLDPDFKIVPLDQFRTEWPGEEAVADLLGKLASESPYLYSHLDGVMTRPVVKSIYALAMEQLDAERAHADPDEHDEWSPDDPHFQVD